MKMFKKVTALMIVFMMAICVFPANIFAEDVEIIYGDADGNGVAVEYEDIDKAINHYLEIEEIFDPILYTQMDVALSIGEIDYEDIDALINYYLELITEFPIVEAMEKDYIKTGYLYVRNAIVEDSNWGETEIMLQLVDESGNIYVSKLADTVEYVNFDIEHKDLYGTVFLDAMNGEDYKSSFKHKTEDLGDPIKLTKALIDKTIFYGENYKGEISMITLSGDL